MSSNEVVVRQFVKKRRGKRIELEIQLAEKTSQIYIESNDIKLSTNPNTGIALTLLLAMKRGARIVAEGNVDRKFYSNLQSIMEIFSTWDSSFVKVELKGISLVEENRTADKRIGCFFSGGVDSFYSLLQNNDEITDLVYFEETDRWKGNELHLKQMTEVISKIGSETGKNVVMLKTNLRTFLNQYVPWSFSHGAALAALGHPLSDQFSKIIISSTRTYNDLSAFGSHPLLDPLWSSEQLEFVHYGADKTRQEKVAFIANHPIALQNLQVCHRKVWENCCECEKCIRTMFNLKIAGALEQSRAFPESLDPMRVARIGKMNKGRRSYARRNIIGMKKMGGDKALIIALEWAILKSFFHEKINFLERSKNFLRGFPQVFQFLKKLKNKIS